MSIKMLAGAASLALGALAASTNDAAAQTAFVWACQPTTASYNAVVSCGTYAYNSRGGAVDVTRSSTGNYKVSFRKLGGRTTAGGHVQVSAYGSGNTVCKTTGWSSGGVDFDVYVRCYFPSNGANSDVAFDVLAGWFGQ